MADGPATPSHVLLPGAALLTLFTHADRERERLTSLVAAGAHETFRLEAIELGLALALAGRLVSEGRDQAAVPVLVAAALRFYGQRVLSQLRGLGAWCGGEDLDRQADELKKALMLVPVTLRRDGTTGGPITNAQKMASLGGANV